MTNPIISVIMPNYNSEAYIAYNIKSILNQTFKNFELIVADDGSTDNCLNIIKSLADQDSRIVLKEHTHTGHLAQNLNRAYGYARGEYIGQVDCDDFIREDCLELCYNFITQNNKYGMVYTDHSLVDLNNNSLGPGNRCRLPYSKETILLNFMTFHFRLLHKSLFEKVNGYDEFFKRAEDYDFCLRASEIIDIKYLNEVLYYYRIHEKQITQEKSLEIIEYSYMAIENAMKRRGLFKNYRLICKKYKKGNIFIGKYSLIKKGGVTVTKF